MIRITTRKPSGAPIASPEKTRRQLKHGLPSEGIRATDPVGL
jgi:hypothetical protein